MVRKMKFPKGLEKGDSIGLIAPAFPIKPNEYEMCKNIIETLGYKLIPGECVSNFYNIHGYLAGEARRRAEDLNRMFADPEIKAIFCARGGYGSAQIIPYLDYEMIGRNPKIFVGFSDITNIHIALQQFCSLVTFYGPMVCSNFMADFDEYTKQSLFAAINWKEGHALEFCNPPGKSIHVIKGGKTKGILTGGNLSLITRSCGSFFQLEASDKILFFEDVNESIPVLDMYITQMEYAGIFKNVKGILFGGFTDCTNEKYDPSYGIDDFLQERFQGYDVPIISHISCGHEKTMGTIPLGAMCEINTETRQIIFLR